LIRAFARSEYLGFEPDAEEFARLTAACSSLLRPNDRLVGSFLGFAPLFEVVDELDIETVAFDEYLPSQG